MTFFYYSFAMALTYAADNRILKDRAMQYSKPSEEVQQNVREVYYDKEVVETVREIYHENSNVNLS